MPGYPHGKPAGVRCQHLTSELRCALYGLETRPQVCTRLRPLPEMCGLSRAEALAYLAALEAATTPRTAT